MSSDQRALVDVAVGVLFRPDGAVLLGQRPAGKPYAGWWEFPGGKLESGESVEHALARELHEELGIEVHASHPWVMREHSYQHARVRLHFQRIWNWSGTPHGREGQALCWQPAGRVALAPLLPAALPVLRMLQLPGRYGISNAAALGDDEFLLRLDAALARGLRLVQLREPGLAPARFEGLFYRVREACRGHGARLLVNSAHLPDYWSACDGVHLRSAQLASRAARPQVALVGASCHDAGELARAAELGCDFAVLGPVRATASHPGATPLSWSGFEALVRGTQIPAFALGGVSPGDEDRARAAGAHGLAMLRGAWPPSAAPNS